MVTRTSHTCVVAPAATAVFTVITIVLALTTCMPVTCGAVPCAPSNVTVAPFAKAVPLTVTLTVVFAGAVFGVTLNTFNGAVVGVMVMVGSAGTVIVGIAVGRFGVGGGCVVVGSGVRVTTVTVGGTVVNVCVTVGMGLVGEMASVGEAIGDAVGVSTIGLPNSRHPKSGAAPIKPVRGTAGISSPFTAVYCVTPLSIAGDDP